ncbi:MAG: YdcF family protein [Clostridia bacterium]|nr:YdcF family protein [Clostridia bacterium]
MKKAAWEIAACAAVLIIICLVCRFTFLNTYTAYIPLSGPRAESLRPGGVKMASDAPQVLLGEVEVHEGYLSIPVHPDHAGEAFLQFQNENGEELNSLLLRVDRFMTVYDPQTGGFTGDSAVLIAITVFWLLVSFIMLRHFFQAKGPDFYAYSTIYYVGFFLFSLVTGLELLYATVIHLTDPARYSMFSVYSVINSASSHFMLLTMPLAVLFAIAMGISNIALLRHERMWLPNMMGLLVSVAIIAGEAAGFYLFSRDFMGSEWEWRVRQTLENTCATVFVYCECMLAGSVVCGVKAAKHQPVPDKDFIIILGCWFRKDGSLPPLLRGRADRAVAFWRGQKEKTGKEARFIPSGGQGKDEPMAEAEAMRRYLLSQGIPDSLILPETRSQNTYQNMEFSKAIIQETNPQGKAVFATTNYHLFRSGVWASLAGLPAEGIGSRTKWWYWPNAFMREVVGLLKNRWKQEILFLIFLIAFFGVLSMVLG